MRVGEPFYKDRGEAQLKLFMYRLSHNYPLQSILLAVPLIIVI
jgi:hypothetical protein